MSRPWFLLRGLVRESAHWGAFLPAFRAAFPDDQVHCLEIPGNGPLHRAVTPLSVRAMVEEVRAQARALAPGAPPARVLALSLGGMITHEWAQRHPQELSEIVLGNTSFGGYSAPYERLAHTAVVPLLRSTLARSFEERERLILGMTSSRKELHAALSVEWAQIDRLRPVARVNALRQLVAAVRYRPVRTPPSVPHLILCGLGDRFVDPACSRAIHRVWNAPYRAHPTAGHDLTLDAGDWVIAQIRGWLAERAKPKLNAAS
jgi:pimeloyl-[acyl-carrier protein] methyl ester esterase